MKVDDVLATANTDILPSLPSLAALLDRPLVVLDVRCRWGFEEKWRALGSQVQLIGFDADAAECRALNERPEEGAVQYVAAALGAAPGPARLYLTREPACSSLYPPDPELAAEKQELACTTLVSAVEIELTTLDLWAAGAGLQSADFIKLDAQGAELDILRERGFVLWRLGHLVHYGLPGGLSEVPIAERSFFDSKPVELAVRGGQLFWAHAYYVRREMALGPYGSSRQTALRDACIAKVEGFDDLAAHAVRNAQTR
jgi:FkbM family methyltransferase